MSSILFEDVDFPKVLSNIIFPLHSLYEVGFGPLVDGVSFCYCAYLLRISRGLGGNLVPRALVTLSFPVPLDKSNEGSGNEIVSVATISEVFLGDLNNYAGKDLSEGYLNPERELGVTAEIIKRHLEKIYTHCILAAL